MFLFQQGQEVLRFHSQYAREVTVIRFSGLIVTGLPIFELASLRMPYSQPDVALEYPLPTVLIAGL